MGGIRHVQNEKKSFSGQTDNGTKKEVFSALTKSSDILPVQKKGG